MMYDAVCYVCRAVLIRTSAANQPIICFTHPATPNLPPPPPLSLRLDLLPF